VYKDTNCVLVHFFALFLVVFLLVIIVNIEILSHSHSLGKNIMPTVRLLLKMINCVRCASSFILLLRLFVKFLTLNYMIKY